MAASENVVRNASLPIDPSGASGSQPAGSVTDGPGDKSGTAAGGLDPGRGGADPRHVSGETQDDPLATQRLPEQRSFEASEGSDPASNEVQDELMQQAEAQDRPDARADRSDQERLQQGRGGMDGTDAL